MNELTTTKLCITLGIFIISFLSSASPLTIVSRNVGDNNNYYFFSVENMFASGVLLAAGLVHQLLDAMKALDDVLSDDFPLATFMTGLIFCFFVIIEECIYTSSTQLNNNNPFDEKQQVVADNNACKKLVVLNKNTTHDDDTHNSTIICSDHCHTHNMNSERTKLVLSKNKEVDYNNEKEYKVESIYYPTCRMSELFFLHSAISITSVCGKQQQELKRLLSMNNDQTSSSLAGRSQDTTLFELVSPTNDCDDEDPVVHSHTEKYRTQQDDARHVHVHVHVGGRFTSLIILLLALSIHSIFKGLGIGISATTTELTSITAAIVAHKSFAGYALGSALVTLGTLNNPQILVFYAVFSSCGSIDVGMGMILHNAVDPENSIPIGIIQAMVAGTFLYVAIVENTMKELSMMMTNTTQHHRKNTTTTTGLWEGRSKLMAFLVGYFLMSVLAIWV